MPEVVHIPVYQLNELEPPAQDKARGWYRELIETEEWSEFVYDDFETVCKILGVRLRTRPVRLYGGGTRAKPTIYFSGFSSQGDGACYEADYSYAKDAPRRIRAHAPNDAELHVLADQLLKFQRRNFYQLSASVAHTGRYYHEYSMRIDVERASPCDQPMTDDAEEGVAEAIRDLARWLYRQLERAYDYAQSDEIVDETLLANAYTFTAAGRRFG
jgi:hypothetical protein